jgi:23S rRNA pseudouridine1911/1915/1917 synthase
MEKSLRKLPGMRKHGVIEEIITLTYQDDQPKRLDHFLVENLPRFSRSRLQTLIKNGLVMVNGVKAKKSGMIIEGGEQVSIQVPPPPPEKWIPEEIPLDIVYENEDVMVVNKPAGMVVHPAAGHFSGTLVHAALAHAPEIESMGIEGIGGERRPGVVHRLDKNTSGIILLAKNDQAHRHLVNRFKDRKVEKVYIALVDGAPPTPQGRIETPIGRSSANRKKMAVTSSSRGREAVTEYKTIETFPNHTLLEVHPITGRTHQIRIHLDFLKCPISGDTVYGRQKPTIEIDRHFLHAARITITLPEEDSPRQFTAPLPPDLVEVLVNLRKGIQ